MGDTRRPHDTEDGVQKRSTKNNDIPAPVTSNVDVGLSAVAALAMLGLVFGGCCSNFSFVAITGYMSQFDSKRPPFFLAPTKVPFTRWAVNIVLFFAINVLNNHAFSYDISVPVHIIIRSGGSITTMVAGYIYGKRYSKTQIMSVMLLSIGVIQAAWSDASAKPMILYRSFGLRVPSQLVNVAANILTQYACIRGVNLLAAASSALTVTIVLNVRKLVSLLLSIWLFDNTLAVGTVIGALLVFGGGAIYTLDSKSNLAKSSSENAGSKKNN
ncbi:UDP-N-acetylglucosamine transporter yea4 [Beauveria bassiana]|nr:UDP-N-acetylglucosamine transporter yea4 [Beauveria bassiana]